MIDQEQISNENALKFFLENLWGKRASGLNLPVDDIFKTVTSENIQYLLNLYPFLQIISTDASFTQAVEPKFITAKSGWVIHDYGEAMSSSLGNLLYSGAEYHSINVNKDKKDDDNKGGEGDSTLKPHGTIIKQAYDTAVEMIEIALQKKWPGIQIIAGTPVMEWAAWAAAEERKMQVIGFEADKNAQRKKQRLKTMPEIMEAMHILRPQ